MRCKHRITTTFSTLGLCACAATLAVAAFAAPGLAGTQTLGSSLSYGCYQEALGGSDDIDALQLCTRALTEGLLTSKDKAATYVNRGIVRSARGDLNGAIHDYDKALHIKPGLGEAFANKGAAFLRREEYEEAIALLNKALSQPLKQPSHSYYNRAIAYESLGDNEHAYADLQQAATLAPDWSWPQRELQRYHVVSH